MCVMSLTVEQKKQIEEEELFRAKFRKGISAEVVKEPKKKKKVSLREVIIIGVGVTVFAVASTWFSGINSTNAVKKEDLNGTVNYKNFSFSVTNLEKVDWNYCHFKLNSDYGYPSSSFGDKVGPIKAGETVSIPSGQFAKKDGTRFNSLSIKPQSVNLDCDGRFGYWKW